LAERCIHDRTSFLISVRPGVLPADHRAEEVIEANTDFDGQERAPMRMAEARITLGVVRAREGDLEGAVSLGMRALEGDRKSLSSLLMVSWDLTKVLNDRLFAVDRGLEVVALVLLMHGTAIRFWNYALYCGIIAAAALLLADLPQPSNYATEGYRVLWTLCGVGIGVLVMLLAGLLAKRTAKAPPQPTAQPA
jgi:hypothetical protein